MYKMNLYEIFPSEIIEIIWNYIPTSKKALLTKECYEEYHEEHILPKITNYHGFMRYVIRNNMNYVFNIHLNYYGSWIAKRNWRYGKQIFCDFSEYINFYSIKFPKIHYILREFEKEFEKEKRKNKHRKMKSKYILWTN